MVNLKKNYLPKPSIFICTQVTESGSTRWC